MFAARVKLLPLLPRGSSSRAAGACLAPPLFAARVKIQSSGFDQSSGPWGVPTGFGRPLQRIPITHVISVAPVRGSRVHKINTLVGGAPMKQLRIQAVLKLFGITYGKLQLRLQSQNSQKNHFPDFFCRITVPVFLRSDNFFIQKCP